MTHEPWSPVEGTRVLIPVGAHHPWAGNSGVVLNRFDHPEPSWRVELDADSKAPGWLTVVPERDLEPARSK